jgi:hypothetical protein
MELTTQQQDLIDYTVNPEGRNYIALARAGTGKTKTAQLAAEQYNASYPDHDIVGFAFNKTISLDLAAAMPFATVKTGHGFAYAAWMKRIGKKINRVNTRKNLDIKREMNLGDRFPDFQRAVSICKAWGMVPPNTPAEPIEFMLATMDNLKFIFDAYSIDMGEVGDPYAIVREGLARSISRGWKGDIDFDDQIYLSTIYKAPFPKGDLLIVDEAQDLNPIQRYMAKQMLKPEGRLFALGDDAQAIYGFRGADRDSIEKITEEFDAKILPLTVSFRCPKAVVKQAQHFVPDIEEYEEAKDGEVITDLSDEFSLCQHLKDNASDYQPGSLAILCRNNAPLISAALQLIKNDIGAKILGRDLEKGLISLIDKNKPTSLQHLNSGLWNYIAEQQDRLILRGATAQAALLEDKGQCLEVLIRHEMSDHGDVYSLKHRIKSMFSDKAEQVPVLLSTIHKAKGMEWQNVYILNSELMPSKYAKTPKEIQQEHNLHYVAITRSQNQLVYISGAQI